MEVLHAYAHLVGLVALASQADTPYHIARTFPVGGDGSWDYVVPDGPQHRLFIGRQNRVMVVDERDGHLIGEVTGINGAHGTAVATPTGHGFATSGNDGMVAPAIPPSANCRQREANPLPQGDRDHDQHVTGVDLQIDCGQRQGGQA